MKHFIEFGNNNLIIKEFGLNFSVISELWTNVLIEKPDEILMDNKIKN